MHQRGEVIIFRPIQIESDGLHQKEKAGRLTVGIIQNVQFHKKILVGSDYIEKDQELLTIRVVGLYRPAIEYTDKLHIVSNGESCPEYSHWQKLRREVLANQIEEIKLHNNCGVDFAKDWSSEVTDLDILFAKYEVDESYIDGLSIYNVQADTNVYRPSIFHRTLMTAKRALRQHEITASLSKSFKSWQAFLSSSMKVKVDAAIIIQKNARTYFERETLKTQGVYQRWYNVQKKYLNDYANPYDNVKCYNVRGTSVYFHTKVIADKWSDEMKGSLGIISLYAKRNIFRRRKEAMMRWKLSLSLQAKEATAMTWEDILSSSINCKL